MKRREILSRFRGPNQGSVREIHREVAVLPHELTHSRDVPGVQRQDLDGVSFEEPPECVLRFRREVELRFFGGLSVPETASVHKVSTATVKRDWALSRAWLHRRLEEIESSRSTDRDLM